MTRDRMAVPREIVPWSSAREWAPIAALLGRDIAALGDEVSALPYGIVGRAVAPGRVGADALSPQRGSGYT